MGTHIGDYKLASRASAYTLAKNLLGNAPNPLTIFSKSAALLTELFIDQLRKRLDDFLDYVPYLLLVLFDFVEFGIVNPVACVELFGDLVSLFEIRRMRETSSLSSGNSSFRTYPSMAILRIRAHVVRAVQRHLFG